MDSKGVIKRLEQAGWELRNVTGDHHNFKKDGAFFIISVQHPRKDIPIGTLKQIERKSGVKLR